MVRATAIFFAIRKEKCSILSHTKCVWGSINQSIYIRNRSISYIPFTYVNICVVHINEGAQTKLFLTFHGQNPFQTQAVRCRTKMSSNVSTYVKSGVCKGWVVRHCLFWGCRKGQALMYLYHNRELCNVLKYLILITETWFWKTLGYLISYYEFYPFFSSRGLHTFIKFANYTNLYISSPGLISISIHQIKC